VSINEYLRDDNNFEIVDLTYPIESEMLVNTGLRRPVFEWLMRINSEGLNVTKMDMIVHSGTHIDAPYHAIADGQTIDEIPPRRFFGRAKLFRASNAKYSSEIKLEDVEKSGFSIDKNTIFVLETGIEKYSNTKEYNLKYSVPSMELVDWLIEKGISAFMTDITNIDFPDECDFKRHKLLLGANIPIVENLRNLSRIPFNEEFIICALPLPLKGREGSPCRAVAIMKPENNTSSDKEKNDV
jgi:kynurenine formamidase